MRLGRRLAHPNILFYALPYLMLLLVVGTIAQREIGLFQATQTYFSSWFFWYGFLPLPGGYFVTAAIFLSLCAKFFLKSEWHWRKSGILLTHLGVMILLVGGILTALTQKEGFLIIHEGEQAHLVNDYHKRGLFISKNGEPLLRFANDSLTNLPSFNLPGTDIEISIVNHCKNCTFVPALENSPNTKGLAQQVALKPARTLMQEEANLSGITFDVSGSGTGQDGTYIATEAAPHPVELILKGDSYKLELRRAQRPLPFDLALDQFRKEFHPGTGTARHFQSDLRIIDGGAEWPAQIQMNEPLRYKGFTFFQSSFTQSPKGEATILAVVENQGRLFPYIATGIIALGLILQLLIRMRYT